MSRCLLLGLLALAAAMPATAAPRRPANRTVVFDAGVLRWQDTREEVSLFGVNYYPPFSINYRDLKELGVDHEQAIREDVAHFVRMNLDLLRLHVWDREISDRKGNLVDNEHLRLLDYLVARCKENGIYLVLTPIAWWGSPGSSDGFSNSYTIHQMTADAEARQAQRTYLAQFVRHKNRYTGLAYAEDPAIAAFELINEPLYAEGTPDASVTAYIDALTDAVRAAPCRKPIFYNGWANRLAALGRSTVDGCTFGWYPTGLVAGHVLRDNYLPRVQDYPSMRSDAIAGKAIGVYEFDAADVPGSYMYPAMARSFRAGGAQFAAQFQYDPLALAPYNGGWQTHYLNLVYAPQKALSFLIASEAFHALPRLKQYGAYPESSRFADFRVSYDQDLSERVSDTVYLYSNSTQSKPPAPDRLERVAGCGSSPLVTYEGTGAYFLDRVAPGSWRLEVYPDAVWVSDPHAPVSLEREVSRVYWREWPMRLSLPDLGAEFQVRALPKGRAFKAAAGSFPVRPGVYLLQRAGAALPAGTRVDAGFIAPKERLEAAPAVWHDAQPVWVSGRALPVRATVAAPGDPEVRLSFRAGGRGAWEALALQREGPYRYAGTLPAEKLAAGVLDYRITVAGGDGRALSFPGGIPAAEAEQAQATPPVPVFSADGETEVPPAEIGGAPGQSARSELVALPGGKHAVRLTATGFGEEPSSAGVRLKASGPADAAGYDTVVVRGRALDADTGAAEVGLVQADGNAFGFDVPLTQAWQESRIPLSHLRPLWKTTAKRPDPARIERISLIFGAWLFKAKAARPHGVEVERVWLERRQPVWQVRVRDANDPVLLLSGDACPTLNQSGAEGAHASTVGGKEAPALRVAVSRFGPPPSCVSFRAPLSNLLAPWKGELARRKTLHLRMRATEPGTAGVEIVLVERDGAPWGSILPLTQEWQDIRLPLDEIPIYKHWARPEDRGGDGDHVRPEDLQALNVCFGSWLFKERAGERHGIEIEGVWLE